MARTEKRKRKPASQNGAREAITDRRGKSWASSQKQGAVAGECNSEKPVEAVCGICRPLDQQGGQQQPLLRCKTCGICVHETCIGKAATKPGRRNESTDWMCMACCSVGKQIPVLCPISGEQKLLLQEHRPRDCTLCSHSEGDHHMLPRYNTHGPNGIQLMLRRDAKRDLPDRPEWVHTLCAQSVAIVVRESPVYGCNRYGHYDDEFAENRDESNSEADIESAGSAESSPSDEDNNDMFGLGPTDVHHFIIPGKNDEKLRERRVYSKCTTCGKKDINSTRIALECSAGSINEPEKLKSRRSENEPENEKLKPRHEYCNQAMHVGCARFNKDAGEIYYHAGSEDGAAGGDCKPYAYYYCKMHAEEIATGKRTAPGIVWGPRARRRECDPLDEAQLKSPEADPALYEKMSEEYTELFESAAKRGETVPPLKRFVKHWQREAQLRTPEFNQLLRDVMGGPAWRAFKRSREASPNNGASSQNTKKAFEAYEGTLSSVKPEAVSCGAARKPQKASPKLSPRVGKPIESRGASPQSTEITKYSPRAQDGSKYAQDQWRRIKGRCDVCKTTDGFQGHRLIECKACGIFVHLLCIGKVAAKGQRDDTWECVACLTAGKEVDVNEAVNKTNKMLQKGRPRVCELCFHHTGTHHMHPLHDTPGPDGTHLVLPADTERHLPARLAWVHTLCAMASGGYAYACDNDGCYENENGSDSEDDESAVSSDSSQRESKLDDASLTAPNTNEVELMETHHFVINPNPNSEQKKRRKKKCTVCGKDGRGSTRIPLTCSVGCESQHEEFKERLGPQAECSQPMHAGCARWGHDSSGIPPTHDRVFFYPGKVPGTSGPHRNHVADLYCDRHAKLIYEKHPKRKLYIRMREDLRGYISNPSMYGESSIAVCKKRWRLRFANAGISEEKFEKKWSKAEKEISLDNSAGP